MKFRINSRFALVETGLKCYFFIFSGSFKFFKMLPIGTFNSTIFMQKLLFEVFSLFSISLQIVFLSGIYFQLMQVFYLLDGCLQVFLMQVLDR